MSSLFYKADGIISNSNLLVNNINNMIIKEHMGLYTNSQLNHKNLENFANATTKTVPPSVKRLGEIFIWGGKITTVPPYAVVCEGQTINSTLKSGVKEYSCTVTIKSKKSVTCNKLIYDIYTDKIPDLRGLFIRGVYDTDTDPLPLGGGTKVELGTYVPDSVGPHSHFVPLKGTSYAGYYNAGKLPYIEQGGTNNMDYKHETAGKDKIGKALTNDSEATTNPKETAPKYIGMYYCMVVK
jgi:hypothetical protein